MKRIFISHSSRDGETARSLCDTLESLGYPCWIAPRDISYGEMWAEEIADSLIHETMLFVFLLSNQSNASRQVLKEINIALNYNIPVVILSIEHVPKLNLSLVYYLSNLHIYNCENQGSQEEISSMAGIVQRRADQVREGSGKTLEEKTPPAQASEEKPVASEPQKEPAQKKEPDIPWTTIQLDRELDAKFKQLFGTEEKRQDPSPTRSRLYNILGRNLLAYWTQNAPDSPLLPESETAKQAEEPPEWDPDEPTWDPFHLPYLQGSYFSIPEPKDQYTLIFQINPFINPKTHEVYYRAERLDSAVEINEDGSTLQTFFVDNPSFEGSHLIILTFVEDKKLVVVNSGFHDVNEVKISKKPTPMPFDKTLRLYDEDRLMHFRADKESAYIIIDPETYQVLQPHPVWNEEAQQEETAIDIIPGKKYFCFSVQRKGDLIASPLRLGIGYYRGEYGLKQNWLEAADCFMQSDEPEAAYYLGYIFSHDRLLQDMDLAREYLTKAAEAGLVVAQRLLDTLA